MPGLTRRNFIQWAAAAALAGPAFLVSCTRPSKKKTIKFLNWYAYIGNETLPNFEKETGIQVSYDIYSSETEMFKKLEAGAEGYDLVVATDHMLSKLKASKLLAPMPSDRLKNLGNIAREFRDSTMDPGLAYTVPYLLGTTGLGFDQSHFPKAPDSWRTLWDEAYAGRITMLDSGYEALSCALLLLNLPTDSRDPAQLGKARDLLMTQRRLVKKYTSHLNDLAAGEAWLAQGWCGDVLRAASINKQVQYVIPREGSFIWRDNLCLVRGSSHEEEVLQFLDYLLRPDVAAEIANTVRYATPNDKAMPLLDPALRDDTRVFPPPEVRSRLRSFASLDAETDKLWERLWQEVKAG